jgi:hypothetical protein
MHAFILQDREKMTQSVESTLRKYQGVMNGLGERNTEMYTEGVAKLANTSWVCAILDEGKRRGLPRQSPRHNGLTYFFPSSKVCWLSPGHRCLPSCDFTQMMPPSTFIENGTDPQNYEAVWGVSHRVIRLRHAPFVRWKVAVAQGEALVGPDPMADDFSGKAVMFVALGVGRRVHVWLPVLVSIGYGGDIIRVIMSQGRKERQQVDETTAVPGSHHLFLDNGGRAIYITSK